MLQANVIASDLIIKVSASLHNAHATLLGWLVKYPLRDIPFESNDKHDEELLGLNDFPQI